MHEQAPLRASRLGAFRQTPAEDPEITDRLLTIESRASIRTIRTTAAALAFAQ
jgi:hypothetical protein